MNEEWKDIKSIRKKKKSIRNEKRQNKANRRSTDL